MCGKPNTLNVYYCTGCPISEWPNFGKGLNMKKQRTQFIEVQKFLVLRQSVRKWFNDENS